MPGCLGFKLTGTKTRQSKKRFHGHDVSMDLGAAASKVATG